MYVYIYSNKIRIPRIIHFYCLNLKVHLYFISFHVDQNRNESNLTDKLPTIPVTSCKQICLYQNLQKTAVASVTLKLTPPFTRPNLFLAQFYIKRATLPNLKVLGKILYLICGTFQSYSECSLSESWSCHKTDLRTTVEKMLVIKWGMGFGWVAGVELSIHMPPALYLPNVFLAWSH